MQDQLALPADQAAGRPRGSSTSFIVRLAVDPTPEAAPGIAGS